MEAEVSQNGLLSCRIGVVDHRERLDDEKVCRSRTMTSSTSSTCDYYRLLGTNRDATPEEIKAAYRSQVRLYHPDLVADRSRSVRREATEMTTQLNMAYECLSDPGRRAAYDNTSRAGTASATWPSTVRDPSSGSHRRRCPGHRIRDLATISLAGIVLPTLVLAWASGGFPGPAPANPLLIATICTGVVAATSWFLTSSRLLRQPDRLTRIGVVWGHLMRWSGSMLVGSCAVVLGIPALAGVLSLMAVIAAPFLGLAVIAVISALFDSQDR